MYFPKPFLSRSESAVKAIEANVMHQGGGTIDKADLEPKAAPKVETEKAGH
ncbi:MAG: hypothetical protein IPK01_08580 [Acidobacteria bacterium]|nr:hypothetical protein [Acidobacteriota bacterium]